MRVRILKGASSAEMFSVNAFFNREIGRDLVKEGERDEVGVVSYHEAQLWTLRMSRCPV